MGNETLTEGYLCPVTSSTRSKARAIVSTADDKDVAAEELFEWVRDTYVWDMTKIYGSTHLLEEQPTYAMSFDKSNLLVSLLRSLDIPARFYFIQCTFYNEYKDRLDDSIHAPVEIKRDGEWVTADPAFGEQTKRFKSVSEFGKETWKDVKRSKTVSQLPRWFVWSYNYVMRFVHPTVRTIRTELRECQDV